MKRQKIRKLVILIAFVLFPVTLYYLSPYLIIEGGLKGTVSGSFIFFGALFLFSLFFGRAFCGWACPAGGLQDCCAMVSDKKTRGGKRDWIKYFIWVPWLISIILIFISAGGIKKIDLLYFTDHGISVVGAAGYIMYLSVVGLIVIMALTSGKRSFCHYVCWMAPFMVIGSKLKSTLKYPSLHLVSDKGKCINCKLCTKKCLMCLDVNNMVQNSGMNHSECVLCGECVAACSKGVIKYKFKYDN